MRTSVLIFAGLSLGASLILLLPPEWLAPAPALTSRDHDDSKVWACPMLCVRRDGPGRCPVCGMELEPLEARGDQVLVSRAQAQIIGLRTRPVERRSLARAISIPGTVEIALGEAAAQNDGETFAVKVELFDRDLAWIAVGQSAEVVFDLAPARVFRGVVSSLASNVKTETRTTTGWILVDAREGRVSNGALGMVKIQALLGPSGPFVALNGRYSCRRHPQIHLDAPGACPVCGLALAIDPKVSSSGTPPRLLAVARDAVVTTGSRHLVFVKTSTGTFEPREVVIGARTSEWVSVVSGLEEGEPVVEQGAFFLDSHLRLTGRATPIAR